MQNRAKHKPTGKVSISLVWTSLLVVLLSVACFCSVTLAWFTATVQSTGNQIQTAAGSDLLVEVIAPDNTVLLSIGNQVATVADDATASNQISLIGGRTYTVRLSLAGGGASGYCLISSGEDTYYSPYILRHENPVETVTFYLTVESTQTVTFTPCWGIYTGDCDVEAGGSLILEPTEDEPKFQTKFTGDFLYRVGNQNPVTLGTLFSAMEGVTVKPSVRVTVEALAGNVIGTVDPNETDWKQGTVGFSGTGVVKLTVTDDYYCIPTELILEVVEATNVTSLSGAVTDNVVLLQNCGISYVTVSGRSTVYGNGFTVTYAGNGQYLNNGLKQGVINVTEYGTLDNLRIVAPIYPKAYLYYGPTLLGDYVQGGPYEVDANDSTKTRYYYQLSAVTAKSNATVTNCYIYGGRNNIFVDTGNVTVRDTVLECGTVANVQIQSNSEYTVTFENLTTIQYQVNPTIGDTSKTVLGAAILVGPETTANPAMVLNGELMQYNWVNADDQSAASDKVAKEIIGAALGATAYNHTVNGKTASNLGIIYMNDYEARVTNNTGLPYVKSTLSISGVSGQAYSLQGATEEQIHSDCTSADRTTVNGSYTPQFSYSDDLGGQYIAKVEDADEFFYRSGDTVYVMFVSGDSKTVDLAALVDIVKYSGQDLGLAISVKDSQGNTVPVADGKVTLLAADTYTVTYTVTDTLFCDQDGNAVSESVSYSWDVALNVSLKDKSLADAYFEFDSTKQKMGYYKPAWGDVKQYIPFLAGLRIYDYNSQGSYLRFDGDADFNRIASVEVTNNYSGNKARIVVRAITRSFSLQ